MYQIVASTQFGKDYKKCLKKHLPLNLLDNIILAIKRNEKLSAKYKVHKLIGEYINCWECHIQPDWLLIWRVDEKNEIVYLVRTGSHSELFK